MIPEVVLLRLSSAGTATGTGKAAKKSSDSRMSPSTEERYMPTFRMLNFNV